MAILAELPHHRYSVFQREQGENGTIHLQGYTEFDSTVNWARLRICFGPPIHIERRLGSRKQARDYCMKEDTRVPATEVHEVGDWDAGGAGQRTDLRVVAEAVSSGSSLRDVAMQYPVQYVRNYRGLAALRDATQHPPSGLRSVTIVIGPPGCGKTRLVWSLYQEHEIYSKCTGPAWFDGYDGHKILLLDEFSGGDQGRDISLGLLLQILDRYPLRLPVKGAFVPFMAEHVWITTNVHPCDWYEFNGVNAIRYAALARRVSQVLTFVAGEEGEMLPIAVDLPIFWQLPHGPFPQQGDFPYVGALVDDPLATIIM